MNRRGGGAAVSPQVAPGEIEPRQQPAQKSTGERITNGESSAVPESSDLEVLLHRLQSVETSTRYDAIDELRALDIDKEALTAEQGRVLLLGAAKHFPPHRNNWTDIPAEIVSVLMSGRAPEPSWAAPAAEAYASLTDRARRNVLALLGAIGDRAA
jgi:hypothetical protein